MGGFWSVLYNTLIVANLGWGTFVGTVFAVGAGVAAYDRFVSGNPFYRRFPVAGRLLPVLDWAGRFWRTHIDARDHEGLPFSRAQWDGIKHLADNKINKAPFGTTKDLGLPGVRIISHAQFPPLQEDFAKAGSLVIGPYSRTPFEARAIFNISAMSFGSLSKAAIEALSRGAAKAGCWLNTGEGGLAPEHLAGGGDLIFQIGTAKFGVRDAAGNFSEDRLRELAAMPQIKAFEIKLAQGAKPGGGGRLPAVKVTAEIAKLRGIEQGKDCISPRRHAEAGSMAELLTFVNRVRDVSGKPAGFKMVLGTATELEEMASIIREKGKAYAPDFITLDGGEGGTGEAPQVLMDNVGLSIRESLPMLSEFLIKHDLKDRIRIVASGKLVMAEDVAWALAAGADFVNSARGFMGSLGCVMAMRCNENKCPSDVARQISGDSKLIVPVTKAEKVANYHAGVTGGLLELASIRGLKDPRQFRPEHINIVGEGGRSVSMSVHYPGLKF